MVNSMGVTESKESVVVFNVILMDIFVHRMDTVQRFVKNILNYINVDLRRSITNVGGMIKDVLKVDARALNAKKINSTQRVCK